MKKLSTVVLLSFLFFSASFVSASTVPQKLYDTARASLGKELWKPGYGLKVGTLGCAAAVCNVMKKSGFSKVSSPVVTVMRRKVLDKAVGGREFVVRNGEGTEISEAVLLKLAKPGDILIATMEPPTRLNGGANAHCGIMAHGCQVYSNNWMNGIWTEVNVHQMFDYYPYIRLLRLPD